MDGVLMAQLGADIANNILGVSNQNRVNRENRQHDIDMFNRQVAYNEKMLDTQVSRKMGDLRRAGLSPAFLNGSQLGASPLGVSTPVTGGSSPSLSRLGIAESALVDNQNKNIEADTENKRLEADRQKIENTYLPALKQKEVSLIGSQIDLFGSEMNLNEEQCKSVAQGIAESEQRIANMTADLNVKRKQVDLMSVEERIKSVEALMKRQEIQATIDNLEASASLSRSEATDIVKTFAQRMYNLNADTNVKKQERKLISWNAASSKLSFHLDQKYKEAEKITGLISAGSQAIENVGSVIAQGLKGGAHAKQVYDGSAFKKMYDANRQFGNGRISSAKNAWKGNIGKRR